MINALLCQIFMVDNASLAQLVAEDNNNSQKKNKEVAPCWPQNANKKS